VSTPQKAAQNRKLGLDKPCSMCGSAIYYNYKGPVQGICGKCTDHLRRRFAPRGSGPIGGRISRGGGGFGFGALALAFLCGAALAVIVLLNGWLPVF
jgi:hypothetical protein